MYLILALLLLSVLIMAHEGGHYWAARLSGMEVQEFSLGMGPLLLHRKNRHGTEFSLRLLPIGGFCSFYGEDEESDDPRAFGKQSAGKRALTVAGGPAMNFLVAFLVIVIYMSAVGIPSIVPRVLYTEENAAAAGLQPGDEIVGVNGTRVGDLRSHSRVRRRNGRADGTA